MQVLIEQNEIDVLIKRCHVLENMLRQGYGEYKREKISAFMCALISGTAHDQVNLGDIYCVASDAFELLMNEGGKNVISN